MQEHWLTRTNLVQFHNDFSDYNLFGSSALDLYPMQLRGSVVSSPSWVRVGAQAANDFSRFWA